MGWEKHFEKDIAYHAETAGEYDAVVVEPREIVNEFLFRNFHQDIPGGGRMLDLGSGTGHSIVRFGALFESVLGVDHSREMLEQAVANIEAAGIAHAVLLKQDLYAFLDGAVSRFDFVTAIGCFHHLPPDTFDGLLQRIFDCLVPGGQLLIADPIQVDLSRQPEEIARWNASSVAAGLAFTSDAEEADEAPLDYMVLKGALERAGFQPVREERAWELFPRQHPPSDEDRRVLEDLHRRFGSSGNVLCTLQRKPRD